MSQRSSSPDTGTSNPLASGNEVNADAPQEQTAGSPQQQQQPSGNDPKEIVMSEEAQNQLKTGQQSRADSGTTAPSRL